MKRLLFLAATTLIISGSGPAHAAQPTRLSYAVFGSGLHAVNATLVMDEGKQGYQARLDTATAGFLARLAPWSSRVVTEGKLLKDGHYMPVRYENTTRWRNDAKTTSFTYDAKGRITDRIVREQGHPDDKTPADPKLANGAVDLASGIIRFFRMHGPKNGCTGQFVAYDGKRRFKVVLANQKDAVVKKSSYTIYSGPAIACTVEVIPDGGKWSKENRGWFKIQEDSRKKGGLPVITVAHMPQVASWLVPVRLDLYSPYGPFVMHLTGATGAVK